MRIDFSSTVASVSAWLGDLGADDDGICSLEAYNAANVLVDVDSLAYGTSATPAGPLSVSGSIAYVLAKGSGPFPNSIFWDNVETTAVPEPATMAALGLGVAALLRKRRK